MASIPAFRNSVERPEAGADAAGADESPPDPGKVSTIWLPLKLSEPPVTRASPFTSTQFVPWTCITLAWPCWPATTSEVACWAARVSANAGSSTIVATFHRVVRLPFLYISLLLLRGTTAWRYPASRPARDRARHDSRERRRALWARASREGRRSKARSSTLVAASR